MEQQSAVAEATPAEMDIAQGPLVSMTPDQRTEFNKTGELPKPKTEEAAPSTESKPEGETKPAGESETPQTQEKPAKKTKTADERIAELEATIDKIRKGSGKETPKPAEPSTAKPEPAKPVEHPPTRPKPTADDKKEDGTLKFSTYEDFVEDLADWKSEQREAKNQRESAQQAQAREFSAKVEEARSRYDKFDEVVQPTATAINTDADISPVIKQLLSESDVLPDILYTLGSDPAELARFVEMAKKTPGKALRYIALTESLIAEELAGKPATQTEGPPAKPVTKAPRPPSEAGGRAAAPPDALEAAAAAGDFRKFEAEATRRQLAKLKTG